MCSVVRHMKLYSQVCQERTCPQLQLKLDLTIARQSPYAICNVPCVHRLPRTQSMFCAAFLGGKSSCRARQKRADHPMGK